MQKAIPLSISMNGAHLRIIERWARQAALTRSEVLKLLIEQNSDRNLKRHGIFGWQFQRPEWQKGE